MNISIVGHLLRLSEFFTFKECPPLFALRIRFLYFVKLGTFPSVLLLFQTARFSICLSITNIHQYFHCSAITNNMFYSTTVCFFCRNMHQKLRSLSNVLVVKSITLLLTL